MIRIFKNKREENFEDFFLLNLLKNRFVLYNQMPNESNSF